MEKLCFEDYEELACYICSTYDTLKLDDELSDVAIIAKYEDTRQIIKEILCLGYDIHSISMHDVEYDGYDSEYIITLCENELRIEPMLRNDRYITDTSSIIYIFNTCSSKVIPYCKGDIVYEDIPRSVFSHCENLESMGLSVPQVVHMLNCFRDKGIEIKSNTLSVEETRDLLLKYLV